MVFNPIDQVVPKWDEGASMGEEAACHLSNVECFLKKVVQMAVERKGVECLGVGLFDLGLNLGLSDEYAI
jgi:hypothetical protein